MCRLSPITFHGDTIFCIDYQNQPFTPMRPIVENMGLAWQSQAAKLNAYKDRWTVTNIATVAQDGIEREMLCLPVRKLPAWLNSINPKKVRPELRPKIELYQAESDDALWNYWMNGRAERESFVPTSQLPPALRAELKALVDARLSTHPASVQGKARAEIWTRFNRHFQIAEYAQLPQAKMPEARDYLIGLEVRALQALPPAPDTKKQALDMSLDSKTYAHGKRFFDEMSEALKNLERMREVMRLAARPGPRAAVLPAEKQVLYGNMNDSANTAVTGLNISIYGLRSACRIGSRTTFRKW